MNKDCRSSAYSGFHQQFAEISALNEDVRALREEAKTGADLLTAARSAARVYADLIARGVASLWRVDDLAIQLLRGDYSLWEFSRRTCCVIWLTNMAQNTILSALDGYLSCFGGPKAIAAEATVDWIRREREGMSDPAKLEFDHILCLIIESSAKDRPNRHSRRRRPK